MLNTNPNNNAQNQPSGSAFSDRVASVIEWAKRSVSGQAMCGLQSGQSPSSAPSRKEQVKQRDQKIYQSALAALKASPNHDSQLPTHNAAAAEFVWERAQGLKLGCPVQKIADEFIRACEITCADSAVVIYNGQVVATTEARDVYAAPWCPARSQLASSSKSIGALALFCFLDDKFRNKGFSGKGLADELNEFLDTPIVNYVDWPKWNSDPHAQKITLRHVLTHTSGLPGNEAFKGLQPSGIDGDNQFGGYDDINEAIRQLDLVENLVENQKTPTIEPGTVYDYSNPGAQVAAAVLSELLKQQDPTQTLVAYVQERIFNKLGMTETDLDIFKPGEPCLYGGIQSTALDLGRIGLMILNGGKWGGRQFISEDAMKIMLGCPDVVKLKRTDQAHLWWLPKDLTSDPLYYAALGYRDSNMHVFPNHGLIFVRLQSFNFDNQYFQQENIGCNFVTFPADLVKRHLGAHPIQGETNLSDLALPPIVE
jgi:CubicO group peptidase (beta-lactamase class C family)